MMHILCLCAVAALASVSSDAAITVSLLDYGGVGDGTSDNTGAFARAVAAVAAAGGGTLVVPAGTFLTRAFNLTSSMTLFLGDGASIQSSVDFAAWPLVPSLASFPGQGPRYAPLIGGVGLRGVRIVGNASAAVTPRIDGVGLAWALAKAAKLLAGERPHAVEMLGGTDFELAHLIVEQSAFWSVHPAMCVGVWVHDVRVVATTPNGDGVDPNGSADVLIERVSITTSDDAIAIKSGTAVPNPYPAARNITIRHSALASGEACVAIGSEMTAGVEGVTIGPNVSCAAAGHAVLYIKEAQHAGGFVRDVALADVRITGLVARFVWMSQHFGENGENAAPGAGPLPVLANISLANVSVAAGGGVVQAALFNGARAPPGIDGAGAILNIAFDNVSLGDTLEGWSCTNVSGAWRATSPVPCAALSPAAPAAAAAAAAATPRLRALALVNTEDDDNQLAAVVEVNASTGDVSQISAANFSWSTQAATSLDCATTFAPAAAGAAARWLSIIGDGPSVAAVDASSGALLGVSPALSLHYIIASINWDVAAGLLVAVAQAAASGRIDLVSINATLGTVAVITAGLADLPFPQPCQSALSLATGTLYTVSNDVANDDADQTVDSYELASGRRLASVPWPAKTAGAVGRPIAVPPAQPGGDDTLVLYWVAPESGRSRPLRFLQLDLATAAQRILAELPAGFDDLVIDIGGQSAQAPVRAADGSFSIVALGFDNAADTPFLLRVGPVAPGASGPQAKVAMTQLATSGALWSPVVIDV